MNYVAIEINKAYNFAKIVWSDGTKMIITIAEGMKIATENNVPVISK